MRIAISSQGTNLDSEVDPRFGRAAQFILIDTESGSFDVIENNQNLNLPQGAGIQTAQTIAEQKAEVVLTGNCGPKAFKTLQAAGVKVVTGVNGKIKDALKDYQEGKYQEANESNVQGHWM